MQKLEAIRNLQRFKEKIDAISKQDLDLQSEFQSYPFNFILQNKYLYSIKNDILKMRQERRALLNERRHHRAQANSERRIKRIEGQLDKLDSQLDILNHSNVEGVNLVDMSKTIAEIGMDVNRITDNHVYFSLCRIPCSG